MISRASATLSKLERGSPMPMKTMLLTRFPAMASAERICPMISPVVRWRLRPSSPEAQNLQPKAQPTWEETQRVTRSDFSPFSAAAAGMMTDSTRLPSSILVRNFRVVSAEPWISTISGVWKRKFSASRFLSAGGRLLIASKVVTRLRHTQSRTCWVRNLVCPCSVRKASSFSSVWAVMRGRGGMDLRRSRYSREST